RDRRRRRRRPATGPTPARARRASLSEPGTRARPSRLPAPFAPAGTSFYGANQPVSSNRSCVPPAPRSLVPTMSRHAVLLLSCRDRPGIVAAVAGFVTDVGGNIVEAEQHTDPQDGMFFQRVQFTVD